MVVLNEDTPSQALRGFENVGGTISTSATWTMDLNSRKLDVADWDNDGRDEVLVTDDDTTRDTYVVDLENEVELAEILDCSWARFVDWSEDGIPDVSCLTSTNGRFYLYESK